jgi:hypothetical protein
MTEPADERRAPPPSIPLLLFAAVDLVLALLLLLGSGFSVPFLVAAVIGTVLAVLGLRGVRQLAQDPGPDSE